jgi:arylformamidase
VNGVDYEAEYNNRARVPEHPGIIAGWARDAAAYRETAGTGYQSLSYGSGERQVIDLFGPQAPRTRATVMFIHGGYWQSLSGSFFSHMARGLNAHGIAVAVPSYDLCPSVGVGDILDEMRKACRALAERGPLVVSGHSAGGHLAACLLATDWQSHGLPEGLVAAAVALSGLFDLEPLVGTSVNGALGMSAAEARRLSPILWDPPAGRSLDAVVGGEESAEYLRQSRALADLWGRAGVHTRFEVVPGANHFTIVAPLAEPDSVLTRRLAQLAGSA